MGNTSSRQLTFSDSLKYSNAHEHDDGDARQTTEANDNNNITNTHHPHHPHRHHRSKYCVVSLSGKQLRELPDSFLESSKEATFIDVSKNRLRTLPDNLESAANLEKLALGDNLLTALPNTIGKLGKLRWLDLTHNMLSELPSSIANCQELVALGLSEASFRQFPEVICQLNKLRCVGLFNNAIQSVTRDIGRLVLLEKLDLSGNHIHSLPNEIANLTKLHWLNLSNNKLTHIPDLTGLTVLEELGLSNNQLQQLPDVSKCIQLRVLSAFDNQISHLDDWMGDCQSLVKLDLSQNKLTNVPVQIFSLPNLDFLNLKDNPLKEIGMRARLGRCMHKLDLQNCALQGIPEGLLDRNTMNVEIRVTGNPFVKPGTVLLSKQPYVLPTLQSMLLMDCLGGCKVNLPNHLTPPSLILNIVICAVCRQPFTWPEILTSEQRFGSEGSEMTVFHSVCSPHCLNLHHQHHHHHQMKH